MRHCTLGTSRYTVNAQPPLPADQRPASAWSSLRVLQPAAAATVSGLVAGVVYVPGRMLFAALLTPHESLAPLSRIAALLLGPDVLPPEPAGFVVVSMALMIHLTLSIVCGQLIGRIVHGCSPGHAVWRGAAFGVGLFVLNYLWLAPRLFPWFVDGAHAGTAVSHLAFGAIAAGCYALLCRDDPSRES